MNGRAFGVKGPTDPYRPSGGGAAVKMFTEANSASGSFCSSSPSSGSPPAGLAAAKTHGPRGAEAVRAEAAAAAWGTGASSAHCARLPWHRRHSIRVSQLVRQHCWQSHSRRRWPQGLGGSPSPVCLPPPLPRAPRSWCQRHRFGLRCLPESSRCSSSSSPGSMICAAGYVLPAPVLPCFCFGCRSRSRVACNPRAQPSRHSTAL